MIQIKIGGATMSEWITDRLPTEEDAVTGKVLMTGSKGEVWTVTWQNVSLGEAWMRLPAPYVKPKRWTVMYNDDIGRWYLYENGIEVHRLYGKLTEAAAQRIADVYNEVMQ
jgi:hypothetical protein